MISIFYIAALIAVLASIKVISSRHAMNALLYLVVTLLATAVVFFTMHAYFSAVLVILLFVGGTCLLFLLTISVLKLSKDVIEEGPRGIRPKIWLGPLILAFILFVIIVYAIVINDYYQVQLVQMDNSPIVDKLLGGYILVVELAVLLLLGASVIGYHFVYSIYNNEQNRDSVNLEKEAKHDPIDG